MDKDLSENLTATDQSANNDQTSSNNEQSQINQISAELSLAGTEQSDESTQDILRNRIMPMMGSPEAVEDMHLFENAIDSGFHIFNVRQDMWQDRMPLLEAAISRYTAPKRRSLGTLPVMPHSDPLHTTSL